MLDAFNVTSKFWLTKISEVLELFVAQMVVKIAKQQLLQQKQQKQRNKTSHKNNKREEKQRYFQGYRKMKIK